MKIKVIGLQENVKVTYEGNDYFGRRLHYSYPIDNGVGVGAGSQFLNDTKFGNVKLELNKVYWCDRAFGKLANFTSIEDISK